ncbi:hypothetical protein NL676_021710 [Syzygium grande]|nr:hypothetical protein NL676_021710 [Syzygium grande]
MMPSSILIVARNLVRLFLTDRSIDVDPENWYKLGRTSKVHTRQWLSMTLGALADSFSPFYARTSRENGCAPMEVSPMLAYDPRWTTEDGNRVHDKVKFANLCVKILATS